MDFQKTQEKKKHLIVLLPGGMANNFDLAHTNSLDGISEGLRCLLYDHCRKQ